MEGREGYPEPEMPPLHLQLENRNCTQAYLLLVTNISTNCYNRVTLHRLSSFFTLSSHLTESERDRFLAI